VKDLFLERVAVSIADAAREYSGLSVFSDPDMARRCQVAMGNRQDISDDALSDLNLAFAPRTPQIARQGRLLSCFWKTYPFALSNALSRLLVNPPSDINPGEGFSMTLKTQSWVEGIHGACIFNRELTPIEVVSIPGAFSSFFDDVTVFWDYGFGEDWFLGTSVVVDRIMPGSTVTLVRPSAHHNTWIGWSGIDLSFKRLLASINSKYKLRELSVNTVGNIEVAILGVEAK